MMVEKQTDSRGFTTIELLVVISAVALLFALAMPAIYVARQSAVQVKCANNLHQIGTSIHDRMSLATSSIPNYCSGAWLPQYDGELSAHGWVADLRANGIPKESLMCPTSEATMSAALSLPYLQDAYNKGKLPSSLAPGGIAELTKYRDDLIANDFNTNYCQIWTMARTDLLPVPQRKGADPNDVRDPLNCMGPLLERQTRFASSEKILLLADAQIILGADEPVEFAAVLSKGPVGGDFPDEPHEFDGIGAIHGTGKRRQANVLFADGHVDVLEDEDGDGKFSAKEIETKVYMMGLGKARPMLPSAP